MNKPSLPSRAEAEACCHLIRHLYNVQADWNGNRATPAVYQPPAVPADLGFAAVSPLLWTSSTIARRRPGHRGGYYAEVEHSPIGLVARRNDGSIMIGFRGTRSTAEWSTNIRFGLRDWSFDGRTYGEAHDGFADAFDYLAVDLFAALDAFQDGSPINITVCGHSLGGALATLAHLAVHARLARQEQAAEIRTLTFGGPRVGDENLVEEIHRWPGPLWRYVNTRDPVTKVPLDMPLIEDFDHAGHALVFSEQNNPHHLDTYLAHC